MPGKDVCITFLLFMANGWLIVKFEILELVLTFVKSQAPPQYSQGIKAIFPFYSSSQYRDEDADLRCCNTVSYSFSTRQKLTPNFNSSTEFNLHYPCLMKITQILKVYSICKV